MITVLVIIIMIILCVSNDRISSIALDGLLCMVDTVMTIMVVE
jgi:hypothetical protein